MEKNILSEKILNTLKEFNRPVQLHELSKYLCIKSDTSDYQKLKLVLKELSNHNIIEKSTRRRYSLQNNDENEIIKGIVKIRNNSAYVDTKMKNFKRISIKKKHLMYSFEGDTVEVKLLHLHKGEKYRGEVVKVVSRAEHTVIGIIEFDGGFNYLIPESYKYYVDFLVPQKYLNGAKNGDRVLANMIESDEGMQTPQAEVKEILKKSKKFITDYGSVINEFHLPNDFVLDVIKEAEKAAKPVNSGLINKRTDLRKKVIVTIDPNDAKDFDDALSLEFLPNGNYKLGVHIADVSHYVKEGTIIDTEARRRGNSVYLVDRVIPMLPEILSNKICSLQPNRVRLAFSVFLEYTKTGTLNTYNIQKSIIKSKRRFTYDEVDEILKTGNGDYSEMLINLNKLACTLRKKRFDKGGIDFDTSEVKFILDENKEPLEAKLKKSTPATNLVEECMLVANQAVASHIKILSKHQNYNGTLPFLYRVHDEPLPERINEVKEFFKTFNIELAFNVRNSKEINKFLRKFENRPEKPIANQLLLRAMAKAEYSTENIGHYGLGFKNYTHFTSPIRRYPDLIVHRLIKEYSNGTIKAERTRNLENELKEIGEYCTERERVATEAERASVKLTQSIMAKHFIGKEFFGTVSGIVNFGAFVLLDDLYAEGLLHMRDLRDDYYNYDEKGQRLVGSNKKKVISFGQRIRVRISHVNLENRRIDLVFVTSRVS